MTREEAIKELSVEYFGDNEKIREAKRMAIKALEQEPKFILKSDGTIEQIKNYDVLDKIRAEIEEIYAAIDDVCIKNGLNLARRTINKYTAESEGKENADDNNNT